MLGKINYFTYEPVTKLWQVLTFASDFLREIKYYRQS